MTQRKKILKFTDADISMVVDADEFEEQIKGPDIVEAQKKIAKKKKKKKKKKEP